MDDFFGIGAGEILLILLVAVIVLGPARMMEFGCALGKLTNQLKKATYDISAQVSREIDEEKRSHTPKGDATKESTPVKG